MSQRRRLLLYCQACIFDVGRENTAEPLGCIAPPLPSAFVAYVRAAASRHRAGPTRDGGVRDRTISEPFGSTPVVDQKQLAKDAATPQSLSPIGPQQLLGYA
jgi:hypothetical protein